MGFIIFIIVLFIVLFLILFIYGHYSEKGKVPLEEVKIEIQKKIDDERIAEDAHWFVSGGYFANERIALDINQEESNVLILKVPNAIDYRSGEKNIVSKRIPFEDIIEVKVNSNSNTITSTSRGSQIGGALVGGVLAGGVGAVIGGLSGKTKSDESVRKLTLEIVVNDISNPVIEIPFYDSKENHNVNLKAGTAKYDEIIDKINLWYRKFTVILHQQDQKQIHL